MPDTVTVQTSPPTTDHAGTGSYGTATITPGPCPMMGAAPRPAPHPEAERLAAADPLLRGGCCG